MKNFQIPEPERPAHIPEHAQWLAGLENGFWFAIDKLDTREQIYSIRCYEMTGGLKFKRLYKIDRSGFNTKENYEFTHLSHGEYCSISQNNKLYRFSLESKETKDIEKSNPFEFRNN